MKYVQLTGRIYISSCPACMSSVGSYDAKLEWAAAKDVTLNNYKNFFLPGVHGSCVTFYCSFDNLPTHDHEYVISVIHPTPDICIDQI